MKYREVQTFFLQNEQYKKFTRRNASERVIARRDPVHEPSCTDRNSEDKRAQHNERGKTVVKTDEKGLNSPKFVGLPGYLERVGSGYPPAGEKKTASVVSELAWASSKGVSPTTPSTNIKKYI